MKDWYSTVGNLDRGLSVPVSSSLNPTSNYSCLHELLGNNFFIKWFGKWRNYYELKWSILQGFEQAPLNCKGHLMD